MENMGEKESSLLISKLRIKSPLENSEDSMSECIETDIKKFKGFLKTGQFIILGGEDDSSHLSSVHELLSCIIIHAKNFQKWVRFTEEILKKINKNELFCFLHTNISDPILDQISLDLTLPCFILHPCDVPWLE